MRGLTADPVRKTYWVYTDQSIWEIGVTNETRDVWKIYLEKGKYDFALQYANVSNQGVFSLVPSLIERIERITKRSDRVRTGSSVFR